MYKEIYKMCKEIYITEILYKEIHFFIEIKKYMIAYTKNYWFVYLFIYFKIYFILAIIYL